MAAMVAYMQLSIAVSTKWLAELIPTGGLRATIAQNCCPLFGAFAHREHWLVDFLQKLGVSGCYAELTSVRNGIQQILFLDHKCNEEVLDIG